MLRAVFLSTCNPNHPVMKAALGRACLALLAVARAWALLDGRDHVLPEDVQAVLPGVVGHRLRPADEAARSDAETIAATLIEAVPLP